MTTNSGSTSPARRWAGPVAACLALLLLSGCALPSLHRHRDALTPQEHLKLGLSYEKNGEYKLALREYEAALPEMEQAHLFMGNTYYSMQRYGEAEASYREAVETMPDDPEPRNNLAWLLLQRREDLEEAERLAREAVNLADAKHRGEYLDTFERIRAVRKGPPPGN
ncbi:tetratricopeptide repeat protein [Desulfohalovibrio reitneri]|uniref:tetratricopeptide repeat protein n=1 Tax=Desulfohalovibrio reitneri TaxID=1307759 RepID=UPI0009DD3171|nr:tetratricopeptide repeat protein [Desulfohalovibrio reitneri]